MAVTVTLPTVPTAWTPASVITYLTSLALAVVGVLATFGIVLPSGVPTDIGLISGIASFAVGGVLALGHHAAHQSTVKAAIAARPESVTVAVPSVAVAAPAVPAA